MMTTKVPEWWKLCGLWQIANTDLPERSYFGHSWVRHSPTEFMALDDVEWCQWCGKHKAEVPDWMDNPVCDALQAARRRAREEAAVPRNSESVPQCVNQTGCETPRDCQERGYCRSPHNHTAHRLIAQVAALLEHRDQLLSEARALRAELALPLWRIAAARVTLVFRRALGRA